MKILVLTKIYPAVDLSRSETPVVHYFAKEWVKKENVKVIVNYPIFPSFCYTIITPFEKVLNSVFGAIPPAKCGPKHYLLDNVDVVRLPMRKMIPHGAYSDKAIKKQYERIVNVLEKDGFVPEVIVGHWWNPQLPLLKLLKEKYQSKTALVLHSDIRAIKHYAAYFDGIDCWGFRSRSLEKEFVQLFGEKYKTFICYSGIPESMLMQNVSRSFSKKISSFLFVGQLIKRKFPAEIILSVAQSYDSSSENFKITYIGEGSEQKRIDDYAKRLALTKQVASLGRVSREEVKEQMLQHECFIMISKNEAYGLVYLEAMSAGCIVIASRNEGFDGIIQHGVNGFLCQAGDVKELAKTIKEINKLSSEEKQKISEAAIRTAHIYTDSNVADMYLNDINKLISTTKS